MLGPVRGPEALTRLLAETDVMILPSHYEGLPLSVLEAQRCGVVVLATDVGAIDEAIQHGSSGFILPEAGCEDSFAQMIIALQEDHAILQQISESAASATREWSMVTVPLIAWINNKQRSKTVT